MCVIMAFKFYDFPLQLKLYTLMCNIMASPPLLSAETPFISLLMILNSSKFIEYEVIVF